MTMAGLFRREVGLLRMRAQPFMQRKLAFSFSSALSISSVRPED